ncbi:MAG: hypothetical protein KA248_08670 [Kiritimatiellae bacterium]|nr:hypothetical protein [Kiritimatiellia bacterium]
MKKRIQMMLVAGAVMAFATAARALPNLVLREMRVTTATNGVQQLWVRVSNEGNTASSNGFVTVYIDPPSDPACGNPGYGRQWLGFLRPGANRFYLYALPALARGEHKLWGFADSTCVVREGRETDNKRSLILRVP